jgi:hypothetical protein
MQTFDTQSEFDAAGMIAYLTAHGYRVSKARAVKDAGTWPRLGGCTPAKAPKGHEHCLTHWKVEGYRKPVCIAQPGTIREDGQDTGQPVGAEWCDATTVLRFALDLAAQRPDPAAVHDRAWWDAWHAERNAAMAAMARGEVAA